jgi:hypothetical protein
MGFWNYFALLSNGMDTTDKVPNKLGDLLYQSPFARQIGYFFFLAPRFGAQ